MEIKYNGTCVIQGGILIALWWAAYHHHIDPPKLWTAVVAFWLFYVLNAQLDNQFGCSHGIWDA